jgi:Major Facilitator Superfamily
MAARPRDLRLVAAAIAVSGMGDFVAVIALALRANEQWKGIGVSVIFIALWSPIAILAGHAGLIVDRFETRAVAIVAALFQCVVAAVLAFSTGSIAAILGLTFLLGVGAAIGQSAEFALVPLLAGTRSLARANGVVESARSFGFAFGPLAGGALAAGAGTKWAMIADSASFLGIAAALASIGVRRHASRVEGAALRARDGLTMLFADRSLATAMVAGALTLVFMSASIPGDFAYVTDDLGKTGLALGLVITLWAVAMILGSNFLAPRVPVHAVAVVALLTAATQGFSKFLAPFWMVLAFMCACYVFGGLSHGVKNTLFRTLIHQRVEPARHGQAFAAYNGLRNSAELIALAAGGGLVAAIGGAGTLWTAGGAAGVVGLLGAFAVLSRDPQAAAARANVS